MPVLPILEIPNPVLRQRAKRIRTIDSSTLRLAYDMVDTMREARGVGLAANQVGVLKRMIVVQLPDDEEARIYINPEIVRREGEREVEEGCLSIPGYKGLITRSVWIRFRAMDHTSQTVKCVPRSCWRRFWSTRWIISTGFFTAITSKTTSSWYACLRSPIPKMAHRMTAVGPKKHLWLPRTEKRPRPR